ncbi:unnamed protein product [Rotaria sp. Silwood2]|nr:unnamed protein product [Rotaria sp. Silwood2]CAF4543038.1 unnamed protein product [Rotaria sp. Silwood2]
MKYLHLYLFQLQLSNKTGHNSSSSLMATLYNRVTAINNPTTHKYFPHLFHEQASTMTLETALDIMEKL